MKTNHRTFMRPALLLVLSVVAPLYLRAQSEPPPVRPPRTTAPRDTTPLPGPPIRRIESATAISKEPLGAITNVRQLSDGRVLVNDGQRRRLLLMDSSLSNVTVILDSLTEVENAYGTRPGALMPFRGDSTMFIDPGTMAMLILDPAGRIVRVRSVPRAEHVNYVASLNGSYGYPGLDAKGRLVYRIPATTAPPTVAPPPGVPYFPSPPDTAFIVAMNVDTRKVDTLGAVKVPHSNYVVKQTADGGFNINSVSNPLPLIDDWAVLSDGTVAFVRGIDYRVEYLNPDGTITSTEKLPFPWVRLTDDDKQRMADSIKAAQVKQAMSSFAMEMIAWSNLLNKPYPATFTVPEGITLSPGLPRDWILPKGLSFPANYLYACGPGEASTMPGMVPTPVVDKAAAPPAKTGASAEAPAAVRPAAPTCFPNRYADYFGGGYTPPAPTYRPPTTIPARDLPDYKPPIGGSSPVRADGDGNLWIRTMPMRPTPGGAVYDIVNRKGELADRIQLPAGYTLTGFGAGKTVFLTLRDATGVHLARVQLR